MDDFVRKLYNGEFYPCEEIFAYAAPESNDIYHRIEVISEELKKVYDEKLMEEYEDLHTELNHIISMKSFEYGMNLGIRISRNL